MSPQRSNVQFDFDHWKIVFFSEKANEKIFEHLFITTKYTMLSLDSKFNFSLLK